MKKKFLLIPAVLIVLNSSLVAGNEENPLPLKTRIFLKEDILKLTEVYINNNLNIENPVIVDVDADGDFDILRFKDGNVECYENVGTLEKPEFILKNKNYDSYKTVFMIESGMPLPVFFADADGDGDMDLFAVKDKGFNQVTKKNDYRILYSANNLDIDTATLVTIILILVVVLLVLAIIR
jgi:hypothetical protein